MYAQQHQPGTLGGVTDTLPAWLAEAYDSDSALKRQRLTLWSDGQRVHISDRCEYALGALVRVRPTLRAALNHDLWDERRCPCVRRNTSYTVLKEAVMELDHLRELADWLDGLAGLHARDTAEVGEALEQLEEEFNICQGNTERGGESAPWYAACDEIRGTQQRLRGLFDSEQLTRQCMIARVAEMPITDGYLAPNVRAPFPHISDDEQEAAVARAAAFRAWVAIRQITQDETRAVDVMYEAVQDSCDLGKRPVRVAQLPTRPYREWQSDSETLDQWLSDIWSRALSDTLRSICNTWDAAMRASFAQGPGITKLALITRPDRSHLLVRPIVAHFAIGTRHNHTLLQMPGVVYDTLINRHVFHDASTQPEWLVSNWDTPNPDSHETLELALQLWEPDGAGIHADFETVLNSARLLVAQVA